MVEGDERYLVSSPLSSLLHQRRGNQILEGASLSGFAIGSILPLLVRLSGNSSQVFFLHFAVFGSRGGHRETVGDESNSARAFICLQNPFNTPAIFEIFEYNKGRSEQIFNLRQVIRMRVSVLQENLAKGLATAARAVPSRPTMPILANVLLATEDGRLQISGNNLELGITARVGAKVDDDGAITVPARTLLELVNTLPPERVDLEVDERTHTLTVICKGTVTTIKGISAEEFPSVPVADTDTGVEIAAPTFQSMIDQVVFAAARDDNRPVLMGVLVRFNAEHASIVAADGYRMSMRTADLERPVAKPISVVIPARTMAELSKIIGSSTESMYISVAPGRNQIMFFVNQTDVVSQLIDGKFPDVEALIPKASNTRTTLRTTDLLGVCRRAEIFAREANNTMRLKIEPGSGGAGTLLIRSEAQEQGTNEDRIEGLVNGPGLEISFNVRYLIDVLGVMDTEQIVLETNTPANPGLIKPEGRQDFTYVVMPMSTR